MSKNADFDFTILMTTIERGREEWLKKFFGETPRFDRHGVTYPIRAGWGQSVQMKNGRYAVYEPGGKIYFQGELFD